MKFRTPANYPIVVKALKDAPEEVLQAAEKGLRKGLEFAQTTSMREYLQGPRPKRLGEVTGRLRGSVAISVQRSGKGVVGRIGSNVKYARYHEFGMKGIVRVRDHIRSVAKNGARSVKYVRDRAGNVGGQKRESVEQAQARGVVFARQHVRAHSRKVDYQGKPFIKPALLKAQPFIRRSILEAIAAINK